MFRVTKLFFTVLALFVVVLLADVASAQDVTAEPTAAPTVEVTPTVAIEPTPTQVDDPPVVDANDQVENLRMIINELQVTNEGLRQTIGSQNWLLAGAFVLALVFGGLLYRSAPPGVIKQFLGDFRGAMAPAADKFVTAIEETAEITTDNYMDDLIAAGLRAGYRVVLQPVDDGSKG